MRQKMIECWRTSRAECAHYCYRSQKAGGWCLLKLPTGCDAMIMRPCQRRTYCLHAYCTSKQVTQHAEPANCHQFIAVTSRSWLVPIKKGAALPPRGSSPDFYTEFTNGAEYRDARPPAAFGHAASLATGFSTQEGHRPGGPNSRPFVPRPSRRLLSSSGWEIDLPVQPPGPANRHRALR